MATTEMNSCAVCKAPSEKRCTTCLGVYYCSREHQKQDWKNHKASTCLPYKVKENESFGLHMVAVRYLAVGELVLKEKPLFSKQVSKYKHERMNLYSIASSMEHSCYPNCYDIFSSTGEIVIRAAKAIVPGEHLSISYVSRLQGTRERYNYLKLFWIKCTPVTIRCCDCIRCLDPTDLGTHFSSLKCLKKGCNGLLVPPDNYLMSGMPWKCQSCHVVRSVEEARRRISFASATRSYVDNFNTCQNFISHLKPYLHENHFLFTSVRLQAIKMPSANFTEDDWSVQLKYCRQLDEVITKIAPASFKTRVSILIRMSKALLQVKGDGNIEESKQIAGKAYDLLKYELDLPDNIVTEIQLLMGRTIPMPATRH